jgi:DNA repair ATPase RecN
VTDPSANRVDEGARNGPVAGGLDISDRLIGAREAFRKFAAQIEQVLAMLQEQTEELRRQQAQCAAMEAALAADREQLDRIAAENRRRQEQIAAQAAQLQDLEAELTARAEALAQRERTVDRLQSAIIEISQALTETDAELVREGLSNLSASGQAPAPAGPGDQTGQTSGAQAEANVASPVAEAATDQAGSEASTAESVPAEQFVDDASVSGQESQSAPAQPEADGSVDESTLDPQTRERLRVMRRLTGGRVPDVELLARIRGEQRACGPSTESAQRKSKRRWWGG